jgi:hypothetical protein
MKVSTVSKFNSTEKVSPTSKLSLAGEKNKEPFWAIAGWVKKMLKIKIKDRQIKFFIL